MTFSLPSDFAAATRASIPPQAEGEVAVLAVLHVAVPDDVLPQAVTTTKATTARPRWRVSLANFILGFPSKYGPVAPQPDRQANHDCSPPTLQGHISGLRVISVMPWLIASGRWGSGRRPRYPMRPRR